MLKRVADLEEQAAQLVQAIREAMPEQYREIKPKRTTAEQEPVGYAWAEVSLAVVRLASLLKNLRVAIEERTGIKLDRDNKSVTHEQDTPILGERVEQTPTMGAG